MAKSLLTAMLLAGSIAPAIVLLPAAASAQEQRDRDPDDHSIIVEGTLEVDGVEARQQARDITPPASSSSEPLARFTNRICAGVSGLSEETALLVINRIYDNAERAGLDIDATDDCRANVWVILVDDPEATFANLREENSWMVRPLERADRRRVERQQGPVRAWNITSTRTREGIPIPTGFELVSQAMEMRLRDEVPWTRNTSMSRTQTPIRRDIDMSVVLVERSAIGQIDAFTLADYATMRALARTEVPYDGSSFDTILTLFGDSAAPDRLTAFDRAYLRSLYRGNGRRPSTQAHGDLGNLMEEELQRE